jgi:hypothetical protein
MMAEPPNIAAGDSPERLQGQRADYARAVGRQDAYEYGPGPYDWQWNPFFWRPFYDWWDAPRSW